MAAFKPAKALYGLFVMYVLLVLGGLTSLLAGAWFNLLFVYVPLALLLLHACMAFTVWRGLAFILLAGFVGFVAEAVSLNYGTLFGGNYTYPGGLSVLGVPVDVIAYWAIFIYIGYWLVTSFFYWRGKGKPRKGHNGLRQLGLVVVADGLVVTAIDLVMDPVYARAGVWMWADGGPYFGVPIGNFVGWFCVTVVVTGVFRLFEYYRPQQGRNLPGAFYLLPVLGYLLTGVNFLVGALAYGLLAVAGIGLAVVLAPALLNLVFYFRARKFIF